VKASVEQVDRRQFLATVALTLASSGSCAPSVQAADASLASAYLPADGESGLYKFVPAKDKTPALRAGVIKPDMRYAFSIPPNFKEARISNTLNGNFCMPNCAEPWYEVVYEDPAAGNIKLLAVPLLKLTNAKDVTVEKLGTPDQLLARIGPYVTGTYFDEDSLQSAGSRKGDDGLTYYMYEIYQLDAQNGPHNVCAVTAKGEVLFVFMATANDKQWRSSEGIMRKAVDSFRA